MKNKIIFWQESTRRRRSPLRLAGKLAAVTIAAALLAGCGTQISPTANLLSAPTQASAEKPLASEERTAVQAALAQTVELVKAVPSQEQALEDTSGALQQVTRSGQPVDWGEAPPCTNQPLTLSAWQALAVNAPEEVARSLQAGNPAESELAALQMNVDSGKLNRETEIELANLPDVHTVGELIDRLEEGSASTPEASAALVEASRQIQEGKGIVQAVCAHVLVTREETGPVDVKWAGEGIRAQALPETTALSASGGEEAAAVKDTGLASPDGKWAAFTSLRVDASGPIYLLDIETGSWINLIQEVNVRIKGSQPMLPEDLWWQVAGWFPDGKRLMLAPSDLSSVFVVDLQTFAYERYGFNGGGAGGLSAVALAPDGSRFVYFAPDPSGGQSLNSVDLATGQSTLLGVLAPDTGWMLYPRFSPDGSMLSYLVQKGHPLTGITYAIRVYSFASASDRTLIEGNLGSSVPTWSPDGQYIAFIRKEPDEPDLAVLDQEEPDPRRGNLWLISVADNALTQLTFLDGWVRNPAWSFDAHTLAFITQAGEVGMVNIDQPGKLWQAAGASSANPLVTSAFFVP